MRSARPVNLDIFAFKFPLTAITSIIHRISGVVLFCGLPLILWALDASLASSTGFDLTTAVLSHPVIKVMVLLYTAALLYHLVAGIRHLLMDLGIAETRQSAQIASASVLVVSFVLVVIFGVWLW